MTITIDPFNDTTVRFLISGVESFRANASGIISGCMAGFRNRIINGNFAVNQRAVSGTVTLAAGAYGHDRFKAGAGGCTYTFAASANGMMLTITAGTLLQIIEGANLEGGAMKLSWFGTATGRIDAGAYGAAGVVGTAVAGTNQTVEFGAGTLARVQYELGGIATVFEQRPLGLELGLCRRYYSQTDATIGVEGVAVPSSAISYCQIYTFGTPMRAIPTVTLSAFTDSGNMSNNTVNDISALSVSLRGITFSGVGAVAKASGFWAAGIKFSAEL